MKVRLAVFSAAILCGIFLVSCLSSGGALGTSAAPAEAPELAEGYARIHYQRRDGKYEGWGLWLFKDVAVPTESKGGWPTAATPFAGVDPQGAWLDVKLTEEPKEIGFVVLKISDGDSGKDGGDKSFVFEGAARELWVKEGDDEVYLGPALQSAGSSEPPSDPNGPPELMEDRKFVIYQMMVRLFGNKVQANKAFGTMEENGVGKFADITPKALSELKALGITHVWYTGVLEHASMDDYSAFGIAPDDADVIKGRAGSPYAIKDYYDVNPQLALDPKRRLAEFDALVARTHAAGLAAMIDFVPNHVARSYHSDAKPAGVADLGEGDDDSLAFSPSNNFYYLPGTPIVLPRYDPLGADILALGEDGAFEENPAKVTGNDVFRANPSVNDWFETVKLNYGVDIQGGRAKHFDPIPSTWVKMKDILVYWAERGVDGFRCDMAEMVPVEFWAWAIPQVRAVKEDIIFLAEIYNPGAYKSYVKGGFDYLYDKVGLYDTLKPIMKGSGSPARIPSTAKRLTVPSAQVLRFLENHDEERIASEAFAKQARPGIPGMLVSVALGSGPVLIYFGQEVGESGAGKEGFGGEDNRTSIFDYWGVPAHQRWMNGGAFDGGGLSPEEKALRADYARLLKLATSAPALRTGAFYDLDWCNRDLSPGYERLYAFLRFTGEQKLLVLANFSLEEPVASEVRLPEAALRAMELDPARGIMALDILGSDRAFTADAKAVIRLELAPMECLVLELSQD